MGAQVVLSGISGKSCTTNSRGRCDIPGLPAGSYGFSATKENFETATGTITMREDGTVVNAIDFYYIQLLPYHGWADIRATQGVNEEPTTATVSYGLRSGCHTTPKNPVCQMIAESEIGPLTFGGHHRHYKDHVYSTGHTLNRGETIEVHINFQCNSNNDCGAGFGVIDDTTYTCNNQKICVRHCEINPNLPEPQTGTCFGGYLCVEADGYNTRICVVMD